MGGFDARRTWVSTEQAAVAILEILKEGGTNINDVMMFGDVSYKFDLKFYGPEGFAEGLHFGEGNGWFKVQGTQIKRLI